MTAKKCTKKRDARAELLLCFFNVLVDVAVVKDFLKLSIVTWTTDSSFLLNGAEHHDVKVWIRK